MAKFNSAWLIHKQQFRSLTGVGHIRSLSWLSVCGLIGESGSKLRRTIPGVCGAWAELRITFLVF